MSSGHGAISRWIFDEYRPDLRALGIYRIIFALSLLFVLLPKHLWIARFPDSFFVPPLSFAVFLRGFPPAWFFSVLSALITIAAVALLVGWRTKWVSLALAVMLVVGNTFMYSLGKVNHDSLLVVVLLVLAFSAWGERYSVDAGRGRNPGTQTEGWPLSLLAFLIGLAMLSAALPKVTSGWLDPSSQAVKSHLIRNYYVTDRPTWFGSLMLSVDSRMFWELLDWSTIFIESGILLACFSRPAMRVFCALAVFFHTGIHFSMAIFFLPNLLAYGAFVEWERLLGVSPVASGLRRVEAIVQRVRGWQVVGIGLAFAVTYELTGNPTSLAPAPHGLGWYAEFAWMRNDLLTVVAAGVAAGYLAWRMVGRWRPPVVSLSPSASDQLPVPEGPIVLFDGVCSLCNGWVDFIIRWDRRSRFHFATLQSQIGQSILQRHGLPKDYVDSIVLVQDRRVKLHSTAMLEILRQVSGVARLLYVLVLVPPMIRDALYDFVTARRFRWFGRLETCRTPGPDERARFLS